MVADDTQAVDRLPMLPESERHRVLYEWNDTKTEFPADKCVHQLFEEQVSKTPDAVAVVFEEEELSYAELNRRANQLAHYLSELGVRPDDRVAICLERGFEMIVGLLAVLKAGGCLRPPRPGIPTRKATPHTWRLQSSCSAYTEAAHRIVRGTERCPAYNRPDRCNSSMAGSGKH